MCPMRSIGESVIADWRSEYPFRRNDILTNRGGNEMPDINQSLNEFNRNVIK